MHTQLSQLGGLLWGAAVAAESAARHDGSVDGSAILLVGFCAIAGMLMNASLWLLAALASRVAGRRRGDSAAQLTPPVRNALSASFALAAIVALAGGAQGVFPHAFDPAWRAQAGACMRDREPMKSDWAARQAALDARDARAALSAPAR